MRLFLILSGAVIAFVVLSRWATPPGANESGTGEKKTLDALYTRQLHDLESLLASGVSANAADPESGDPLLVIATQMRYREASDLLLRTGADVNLAGYRGYTPLMCAVIGGRDEQMLERLIAAGADVNAQAANGMTALMIASMMDYERVIDRLLRAGARVDLVNYSGKSAIDLSASSACRARLQATAETVTAEADVTNLSCNLSR